jgi:hypothetical protein
MRQGQFVAVLLGWSFVAHCASAADWIVAPSYYTHEPLSGHRVTQYAEIGPYYYYHRPDYQKSGYRHYRSTIQTGNTADNMHMVEEYGRPIRPYEEWRFPYRPHSVPYDAWGPPFGGLGGGYGGGLYGGYPYGPFPPNGPIGPGPVGPVAPAWGGGRNYAQPWLDGHYPTYDRNDRSDYYRSYP